MSIATPTTPATPARNLQAKGTVGILNTVRWVGTTFCAAVTTLLLLANIVGIIALSGHGYLTPFSIIGFWVGNAIFVVMGGVCAAFFYAVVGWYVDSLNLLVQIERNTTA